MEEKYAAAALIDLDLTTEPQITSSNPEERKLARRLRVERRLENLRRLHHPGEGTDQYLQASAQKNLLQIQLEKSADVLSKLISEGTETVTNVRVANDSRETDRREAEGIDREKVIEQLEAEASLSRDMFDEITNKWTNIFRSNDPLDINDEMNVQKEKCDELISQKDAIIAMLKEEVRKAETKFSGDQYKQNEDVRSLTQRIEKQVMVIRGAYRDELKLIEDIILIERQVLTQTNNKKWDDLYKRREDEEYGQMIKNIEQREEFFEKMNALTMDYREKQRSLKISLENAVENMQLAFENIKSVALMNREKLDYNYQILKRREDENLIIKSQQKRKINKLQDAMNYLKRKMREYDVSSNAQIARLTGDVKKLQKSVVEIEHKADSLSKINNLKHSQVWDLNIEDAQEILNKIFTIDQILHEQQLGLEWKKPDCAVLNKEDLASFKEAKAIIKFGAEREIPSNKSVEIKTVTEVESSAAYRHLLRHILEQIAGKADFLVEKRIHEILEPYLEEEKTLLKLDNVFNALGVKNPADIDFMFKFFLPYVRCSICARSVVSLKSGDTGQSSSTYSSKYSGTLISSIHSRGSLGVISLLKTVHEPEAIIDDIVNELIQCDDESSDISISLGTSSVLDESVDATMFTKNVDESPSIKFSEKTLRSYNRLLCKLGHPLTMNLTYVIRALRQFIVSFYVDTSGVATLASRLNQKYLTVSRLVNEEDVKLFWDRYRDVFSDSKEHLWDGLLVGLKQYYAILKDRKNLNEEVVCLRRKNAELKHLLSRYAEGKEKHGPCTDQREIPNKPKPSLHEIYCCPKRDMLNK